MTKISTSGHCTRPEGVGLLDNVSRINPRSDNLSTNLFSRASLCSSKNVQTQLFQVGNVQHQKGEEEKESFNRSAMRQLLMMKIAKSPNFLVGDVMIRKITWI